MPCAACTEGAASCWTEGFVCRMLLILRAPPAGEYRPSFAGPPAMLEDSLAIAQPTQAAGCSARRHKH